jgi:hypothetical protein
LSDLPKLLLTIEDIVALLPDKDYGVNWHPSAEALTKLCEQSRMAINLYWALRFAISDLHSPSAMETVCRIARGEKEAEMVRKMARGEE